MLQLKLIVNASVPTPQATAESVRNVDLLNGTPILDIKPYLPAVEAHPDAKAGWIDAAEAADVNPEFEVTYSNRATEQLSFLKAHGVDLDARVRRALSHDPTPHPYKRIEVQGDTLVQAIRGWRVVFRVNARTVTVEEIRSGYADDKFVDSEELSDDAVQRAFQEAYGKP